MNSYHQALCVMDEWPHSGTVRIEVCGRHDHSAERTEKLGAALFGGVKESSEAMAAELVAVGALKRVGDLFHADWAGVVSVGLQTGIGKELRAALLCPFRQLAYLVGNSLYVRQRIVEQRTGELKLLAMCARRVQWSASTWRVELHPLRMCARRAHQGQRWNSLRVLFVSSRGAWKLQRRNGS